MRFRGLFAQVYLHGFLLLVMVTSATAVVGFLVRGDQYRANMDSIGGYLVAQLEERWTSREDLQQELERQHHALGIRVSVTDRAGEVVASIGDIATVSLSATERQQLLEGVGPLRVGRRSFAFPLRSREGVVGYAVGSAPVPKPPFPGRGLAIVATVAVILAAVSVPLVLRIVKPLRVIGATTRALGRGDLGARNNLRRRDEIGELAGLVDDMAERIERSSRIERELVANVSHELRTPLARLRVALELASEATEDRRDAILTDAMADVQEIDELTGDILMSASLDRDRNEPQLTFESHDADQWLSNVVARTHRLQPERRVEVSGVTLGIRRFDFKWLGRALANVIENALKYSDGPIRITTGFAEQMWKIDVIDQGDGILPDEQARVFTPFYRAGQGEGGRPGGFGLGLTLARRVLESHGGRLELVSEPGHGSCFSLLVAAGLPG
ncbi:MAG: HAMP domain-containing sensor histidine kinase [Myxococcota bacterium]